MAIKLINSIVKEKVPRDFAYTLKSSQLDEILVKNNISIRTDLLYSFSKGMGLMIEAFYMLPNIIVDENRLYVRVGALPKKDVPDARKLLMSQVLPELELWIKNIDDLPEDSSILLSEPKFFAFCKDGDVIIECK